MIDSATLVESVLLVLFLPLTVALILRCVGTRWFGASWRDRFVVASAGRVMLPLLLVAVFAMFAWQVRTVLDHGTELLALALPLAAFFVVAPTAAIAVSRMLRLPAGQKVTLTMVSTARNSPIALAVAVAAFSDRPLIAVALVVGPLVELPVLALLSQIVRPPDTSEKRPASLGREPT